MPRHNGNAKGWSNKRLRLNTRHYLALLFIAIFGTYYFIFVRGDFIHLDDMELMTRLLNEPSFVLKDLFFPQKVVAYYRPMIELSYQLDHFLWGDVATGWHLTNIVLHGANAGLVYLLALVLLANSSEEKEKAAFWSALLYGINPLATESVCWVSGRSELILAFFMLSSFSLYLFFKKNGSYTYLLLSGLLYLFAAVTKETALTLPVLIIVFEFLSRQTFPGEEKKKSLMAIGCFFLLTAVYFLFFRRAGVNTSLIQIGVGASGLRTVSLPENVLVLFASLGFYVKKLFIPYPLNLAIHSINLIFYALVGLTVLILLAVRGLYLSPAFRFFAAWILITVSPAIAASVLHIAWVPWAERYLYVPLAGFSMALGLWFTLCKTRNRFAAMLTFAVMTCLLWAMTLQRTYVWADEVRLWEDTARQSDYGPVYYHYGMSLLYADDARFWENTAQQSDFGPVNHSSGKSPLISNQKSEAIEQMKKAIARGFSYGPYIELSRLAFEKGDFDESEQWLRKALDDFPRRTEVHKYLAENYLRRMSGKAENSKFLMKAIDEYMKYVAVQKEDAAAYLKIAQLYRAAHQEQRAVPFLERVIKIDSGSSFSRTAMKYLRETKKGGSTP